MGKNKGFLLTEVIVSIAIVAIMMLAATSVFLSIRRVENHIATRENIIGEVNNIFNIFSSEPNNFIANIRSFYSDTNEKIDETIILFYNKSFVPMANGSSSIICFLTVENNIYTLELEFVNGYEQFPKEEALTRSIRVGD